MQFVEEHFRLFGENVRAVDVSCRERLTRLFNELADLRSGLLFLVVQLARDAIQRFFRLLNGGVGLLT